MAKKTKKDRKVVISVAYFDALVDYANVLDDLLDYGLDEKWFKTTAKVRGALNASNTEETPFEDAFRDETSRLAGIEATRKAQSRGAKPNVARKESKPAAKPAAKPSGKAT